MNKIKFTCIILIIFLSTLLINMVYGLIPSMNYVYTENRVTFQGFSCKKSDKDIIAGINKIHRQYMFIVYKDTNRCLGRTNYLFLDRRIFLNRFLTQEKLAWTYAHECVHKIFCIKDERLATYNTFIMLYESGDMYFKEVAIWGASTLKKGSNYDCVYQILEYLKRSLE